MRKLLLLALLLYNIVAIATISNSYDYEELDGSNRHSLTDDRRNWRKKALLKPFDDHLTFDRRRQDFDSLKLVEEQERLYNGMDRQRDLDVSSGYRRHHHYDNADKPDFQLPGKSSELAHSSSTFVEKESEKMKTSAINCQRPHERFESCFSGCASVTCDNPRDRLRPCYPFCEAGCICVQPYVRDDRTHKCVLPEDCTKGLKGIPDLGEEV